VCNNTPGSYRCVCTEGYTASGSTCVGELPPCSDLLDILHLYVRYSVLDSPVRARSVRTHLARTGVSALKARLCG